jgi:pilus assembly protein CpaB
MAVRSRTWLLLALALASGGLAAFLALRYLREQARPLLNQRASVGQAVLATRDIPLGAIVIERDVRLVDWPGDALPPGFIGKAEDVIGRGVITPVRQNEPFLETKLAPKGAGGGLPIIINEGMRGLTMRVNEVSGVAGFVTPNTRVDVLLTMEDRAGGEPSTRIIMQDMRVLAAGQSLQPDKEGKPQPVPVVTFLVSPEQAETLALASGQGSIQLALRNQLDTMEVKTNGTRRSALMRVPGRAAPARRASASPVAPSPQPESQVVEVYRGGVRTLMRF